MKHRLLPLGIIVLGLLAFGTYPANGQTTAIGPYYATPSWDQKFQCDTKATCPRFIVLSDWNNEAVLDRETGRVWERYPLSPCLSSSCIIQEVGKRNWKDAELRCHSEVRVGNRGGWRLPTLQELMSLVDYDPANPSVLPAGHPFIGVQPGPYWTASSMPLSASGFYLISDINFENGSVGLTGEGYNFVWCVRGGQGVLHE